MENLKTFYVKTFNKTTLEINSFFIDAVDDDDVHDRLGNMTGFRWATYDMSYGYGTEVADADFDAFLADTFKHGVPLQ
jgi:hypothetical protein